MSHHDENEILDLKLVQNVAIKACRIGREVLLNYFGNLENIEAKFQAGLVSEADREAERVIKNYLLEKFPQTEFLGEESSYGKDVNFKASEAKAGRWILDPLDGTTNYIHRFPVFCISLGFEHEGEIKVAVIDVPLMNETYTAIKGKGAFLNGRSISVSKSDQLKDCLLATGFFADKPEILNQQLKIFEDLVRVTRGIRRPGAAAYDLCMVARGSFDGFWEKGLSPWDVAAGKLLVQEAGGIVTNFKGGDYSVYESDILACGPNIFSKILEYTKKYNY